MLSRKVRLILKFCIVYSKFPPFNFDEGLDSSMNHFEERKHDGDHLTYSRRIQEAKTNSQVEERLISFKTNGGAKKFIKLIDNRSATMTWFRTKRSKKPLIISFAKHKPKKEIKV